MFFAVAALVVSADQFTKWLVRQNLDLYEQWPSKSFFHMRIINVVNDGAAFGMLQGHMPFLIVTSCVGLAAIVLYYVYPPMEHGLIRVALGMQLGGAVGNLIDRLAYGYVIDFLDVYYEAWHWPAFNIADSAITLGVMLMLVESFGIGQPRESA